jgi:hypothetical protein
MYAFVVNGNVMSYADDPFWLQPLFNIYPNGQIVDKAITPASAPTQPQPVSTGTQTL